MAYIYILDKKRLKGGYSVLKEVIRGLKSYSGLKEAYSILKEKIEYIRIKGFREIIFG